MDAPAEDLQQIPPDDDQFHDAYSIAPSSPKYQSDPHATQSPRKVRSPVKYRATDSHDPTPASPLDILKENTLRFNEGLTMDLQRHIGVEADENELVRGADGINKSRPEKDAISDSPVENETDITLSLDDKTFNDDTVGDLSTISAIPTDLTRFANLGSSPLKAQDDPWSPSKQLRTSTISSTPGPTHRQSQSVSQRPLHLVSRHSNSSVDGDDEATPRRSNNFNDSPTDLLNFTGQSNVFIPPPGSAPRTSRRSPSGRGAFPVRVNPSPSHRSQASIDRERSAGRSPQKQNVHLNETTIPATPSEARKANFAVNGLGHDLLDIDLEPMATPRSIPTVTPRELETLRSELQSRISGLEATLSGKEAEVSALKRSITEAEIRAGKTSEELRTERAAKDDLERERAELERRSREMENVLREVKQNAFVEEREREKMKKEIAESERKAEEAEVKILELTASLQTLREERIRNSPSPLKIADPSTPGGTGGVIDVDAAVKQATESVARELHALYKSKHERKVADLKVSYEKRWARKVEGLEQDLKKSQEELLKLQTERDATMSGIIPGQAEREKEQKEKEELLERNEKAEAERKMLQAQVAGLEEQMATMRGECEALRKEVEQERIEKGELVAQVDLFLTMSEQEKEAVRKPLPDSPSPPRDREREQAQFDRPCATHHQSPSKATKRMSVGPGIGLNNGAPTSTGAAGGRPRPLSMLKPPGGGKFSGIPAPGGKTATAAGGAIGMSKYAGGGRGIMEGIARMGAAGR